MNIHYPWFLDVAHEHGPRKWILYPRGSTNYLEMFQIVHCVIAKLSWKFHGIPPIHVANRHAAVPKWETVKQSNQVWNSLGNNCLCRAWHFVKIPWASFYPFLNNSTNKHGSRQKIDPGFTATFRKCSRLLRASSPSFDENFMKIRFPAMLLTDTDSPGKVKKSCVQRVKWSIPKMFQIIPCTKSHLPWKFHENPFSRSSVIVLTGRQTNKPTAVKT